MAPDVSVVIPSQGRRETRLAFALEALERQTLDRRRFEVVVVRDPAPGPLAALPDGLRARALTASEPTGPAEKRNLGWRAAEADLVAFTDDDCRPSPNWLEALVGAARPGEVLQGRTEPDPDERHLLFGLARSVEVTGFSPWFESCNIAYPRELLERLGGFDEEFSGVACEDTDLGLRAEAAGASIRYVEDALVWHAVHPRQLPRAVREARERVHYPRVVARHPVHRRALYRRVFWQDSHAALLLAAAGLLTRRRALALAAAAPYLAVHLRPYRRSLGGALGGMLDLPTRAAADGVEVGAMALGALRHRVLVV